MGLRTETLTAGVLNGLSTVYKKPSTSWARAEEGQEGRSGPGLHVRRAASGLQVEEAPDTTTPGDLALLTVTAGNLQH